MIRFLQALLGLGQAGVNLYMIARARFFVTTAFLFLLILFEWMLNYWGFIAPNIIITFALFIITIVLWTRPEIIVLMEAMETARTARKAGGATVEPRVPNENYFLFYLAYVLLWASIVSMFVTTLPFGWYLSFSEAFVVTFVGLMFISVIAWTAFFKWTKVVYYKRIIMTYAICGLLICVWMIIPGSIKYWATGIEFYGAAGTSESAKAMAKTDHKIKVKVDKDKAKRIKEIGNIIAENGGSENSLSFEEKAIWHEAQKEVKDASLPKKLSQIELPSFGKKDFEYVPPPPVPMAAPATNAMKAESPEEKPTSWIQMAGKYQVCLNGACNEFELWKNGQSVTSESFFPRGEGKLVFEAKETSPGKLSGSLKQIGHPLARNEEWSFENISCSDISCSGKYTHDKTGGEGNIIIDKMS